MTDATETARIVDAAFHLLAERQSDVSVEEAVEGAWSLFERGFLRLVGNDERVGVEFVENRAARRAQASLNRKVVIGHRINRLPTPDRPTPGRS